MLDNNQTLQSANSVINIVAAGAGTGQTYSQQQMHDHVHEKDYLQSPGAGPAGSDMLASSVAKRTIDDTQHQSQGSISYQTRNMHQLSSQGILGAGSNSGLGGASDGMLVPASQSVVHDASMPVINHGRAFGAHRGSGGPVQLQPLQAANFQSQGLLQGPGIGQQSTRTLGVAGQPGGSDFGASSILNASSRQLNYNQNESQAQLPPHIAQSVKASSNLKFGLNPKTKIGGGPSGLTGGPMRGIHPHPFSHPFKRSKLNDQLQQKNEELAKMILPEIKQRRLDDLFVEGAENPFKVHKTGEQLLVFREKQRQLEKLQSIKSKIEHKYLYGDDLLKDLSHKGIRANKGESVDRAGMIREVATIPAQKAPAHLRSNSIQPGQLMSSMKAPAKLALYADPSQQSIQQMSDLASETPMKRTLMPPSLSSPEKSVLVGSARFRTPAPGRSMTIIEDPLRYLKQKSADQGESIGDYISGSRQMLHHNIAILDKEREVAKLNSLIGDEEKKLHAAKKAFEEDTQRFNTFLFEAKQVGDRLEEQFKETNDNKRALEDQVQALRSKIEDVDAEIQYNHDECLKNQGYMEFLNWLIKEFRPRLAPEGGLQALSEEAAEAMARAEKAKADQERAGRDGVFMTEQHPHESQQSSQNDPTSGQYVEGANDNGESFRLQDHIPISHTDVHRFVSEICQENLFLINLNNEEQETTDKLISDNNEQFDNLNRQIRQTQQTIETLSERKKFLGDKVQALTTIQADEKEVGNVSIADADTPAAIAKRNMNMQQLPLYPKLVERILDMFETLFGEKFQSDQASRTGPTIAVTDTTTPAEPRRKGVQKIDSTTKLPSESRQISAVGSIRTVPELPGEEGGSSYGGESQAAHPLGTHQRTTKAAPSKLSMVGSESPSKLTRGTSKTANKEAMLRTCDYATLLRVLRDCEERMHLYCEVFDKMSEMSKSSRKIDQDFQEVLRKAEADRKYKKYLEAQRREKEESELRHKKNIERMAKKEAVHAEFGKKKMVRENVPEHRKQEAKKKKVHKDVDFLRYFGDEMDLEKGPQETDRERRERIEEEAREKERQEQLLREQAEAEAEDFIV